jgi:hypothetical protein
VSTSVPALRHLDEVVAERRLKPNDCRGCKNFEPAPDGLGYGWCGPHRQYVKLYWPPGAFFSQCRFKSIQRPKREALVRAA